MNTNANPCRSRDVRRLYHRDNKPENEGEVAVPPRYRATSMRTWARNLIEYSSSTSEQSALVRGWLAGKAGRS